MEGYSNEAMKRQQQEENKKQAEEQRYLMLSSICSTEARERLNRLALVKPDKARQVEDLLLSGARTGRIRGKVTEAQLITMLDQGEQEVKVKVVRRKPNFDSDDEDLDKL
jgi:programmed cell death protein 5